MAASEFRTRILILLGAIGYLVGIGLLVVDILPTFDVPLQSIFIVLGTASALLGVDFGLDIIGSSPQDRPRKPNDDVKTAQDNRL
jgi:hypothetical protein